MAMAVAAITVTTTPVLLDTSITVHDNAVVVNVGTQTAWLGDSSVTSQTGTPLEPGKKFGFTYLGNDMVVGEIYAVTASGQTELRLLETGT